MEYCMKHFLKERLILAQSLLGNIPGASYADVVLIVTAVLSACASIRWPGKGIDKGRFIELLVAYSPAEFHASWVSIPTLINAGLISESDTLYTGGNSSRVFRDEEIDLSIGEARKMYPELREEQLRKHCYASLIYEWLRCGYAHEYCPHDCITQVPASREKARVSYIGRLKGGEITRMVSFHLDYLLELADSHVSVLPSIASSFPASWWVHGE
jgi:hypothetical protein